MAPTSTAAATTSTEAFLAGLRAGIRAQPRPPAPERLERLIAILAADPSLTGRVVVRSLPEGPVAHLVCPLFGDLGRVSDFLAVPADAATTAEPALARRFEALADTIAGCTHADAVALLLAGCRNERQTLAAVVAALRDLLCPTLGLLPSALRLLISADDAAMYWVAGRAAERLDAAADALWAWHARHELVVELQADRVPDAVAELLTGLGRLSPADALCLDATGAGTSKLDLVQWAHTQLCHVVNTLLDAAEALHPISGELADEIEERGADLVADVRAKLVAELAGG